jgi:SAM-dependent methyltransferase
MTYKSLFILGRTAAIARAELESLLGAEHLERVDDYAVLADVPATDVPFARLGGTIKLATVLAEIPGSNWHEVQAALATQALALAQTLPEDSKVQLGLSTYGIRTAPRQLLAAGLTIKKGLRAHNYSVRLVPNQEPALSSAQVLHNHLTGERGLELLAVRHGTRTIIARSVAVQDINAYAARDQARPKRDARVGMLPPKLAQTIVNLAATDTSPLHGAVVLDPFCGTGVVLQEAILMGFDVHGTDLDPRMVEYTDHNLKWLQQNIQTPVTKVASPDGRYFSLEAGDATNHQWQPQPQIVACETYLGRPLSSWPSPETLRDIISNCDTIIEKFLRNLHPQLQPDTRLCLAIPAWIAPNGRIHHLPLLDHLGKMGYNRVSFEHARNDELVYYRPNQIVGRELLVITRN